ncbi:hypothetical protein Y032_0113g360 [Ancylostoma ceylanicum]|uniref:Uncharacterized protein n=1 Tax=Ancylostoma ceylanicum TaxID=53326 RepID=A0A016TDE1_9BILA|nr:hypothetical protein Y032_0113g360 [Ancylostoma ceylanicum]
MNRFKSGVQLHHSDCVRFMMKAGLVLFIMLVIFAVLEAKVGVVENADKCRVAHNFRQVFDDGHNKLRMEMGLPEMIYDCEFEQAAAKEEEQPGYAEKNNYGKLTFTRLVSASGALTAIATVARYRPDDQLVRSNFYTFFFNIKCDEQRSREPRFATVAMIPL